MISKYLNFKFSRLALFFVFTISFTLNTITSESFDELDDIFSSISATDLEQLRYCEPGEAQIFLTFLTNPSINIPAILDPQFYKNTAIPRSENIIRYPNFQLCTYQEPDQNQLTVHLFFNQTTRKNYTQSTEDINGTRIGSYLNIENQALIRLLQSDNLSTLLPPSLAPLKSVQFPDLLRTIADAHFEERRLGGMLHFYHETSSTSYLELKTPVLWMIRNLNFTQEEKNFISKQLSAFQGSNFNEDEFARQHLIMDAFGFGTTELSWCKKFFERSTWSLDGGAYALLPTDYLLAKGLYGTYIEPQNQNPILNLCSLVNIQTQTKNPDLASIVEKYFLAAIDHLSSNLLQCNLGYNKTLGFGLKLAPYWQVHDDLEFNALYNLEFFFPYEQKRFFAHKDANLFSEIFAKIPSSTDKEADAKLLVLEERLTSLLFPRVFSTKVSPGIVFTSVSALQKSFKRWNFTVGYSGFYQSAENFIEIYGITNEEARSFDIAKSKAPEAWSVKLFGKLHRLIHTTRHDVSFSLWGDATVFNNAVGNDFSIGISFDTHF